MKKDVKCCKTGYEKNYENEQYLMKWAFKTKCTYNVR